MKTIAALFLFLSTASLSWGQLPDAPSATADRNFWALTGINAGATLADAITTAKFVGHGLPGHPCQVEAWNPELYGRKPSDARVFAVMGAQAAAATSLSYLLKKKHAHIWKFQLWTIPLAFEAQGHARGAIFNVRTCNE
jgi:hypothetical protein